MISRHPRPPDLAVAAVCQPSVAARLRASVPRFGGAAMPLSLGADCFLPSRSVRALLNTRPFLVYLLVGSPDSGQAPPDLAELQILVTEFTYSDVRALSPYAGFKFHLGTPRIDGRARLWFRVQGVYSPPDPPHIRELVVDGEAESVTWEDLEDGIALVRRDPSRKPVPPPRTPASADRPVTQPPPAAPPPLFDLLVPYPVSPNSSELEDLLREVRAGNPVAFRLRPTPPGHLARAIAAQGECHVYLYTLPVDATLPRAVTHRLTVDCRGITGAMNHDAAVYPVSGRAWSTGPDLPVRGALRLTRRMLLNKFVAAGTGEQPVAAQASGSVVVLRRPAVDPVEADHEAQAAYRRRLLSLIRFRLAGDENDLLPYEQLSLAAARRAATSGIRLGICAPSRSLAARIATDLSLFCKAVGPAGIRRRWVFLLTKPVKSAADRIADGQVAPELADELIGKSSPVSHHTVSLGDAAPVADASRLGNLVRVVRLPAGEPPEIKPAMLKRPLLAVSRTPEHTDTSVVRDGASLVVDCTPFDRVPATRNPSTVYVVGVSDPRVTAVRKVVNEWIAWTPRRVAVAAGTPARKVPVTIVPLDCPYETDRVGMDAAIDQLQRAPGVFGADRILALSAARILRHRIRTILTPNADYDAAAVLLGRPTAADASAWLDAVSGASPGVAAAASDVRWAAVRALEAAEQAQSKRRALDDAVAKAAKVGQKCTVVTDPVGEVVLRRLFGSADPDAGRPFIVTWNRLSSVPRGAVVITDVLAPQAAEFLMMPRGEAVTVVAYSFEVAIAERRASRMAAALGDGPLSAWVQNAMAFRDSPATDRSEEPWGTFLIAAEGVPSARETQLPVDSAVDDDQLGDQEPEAGGDYEPDFGALDVPGVWESRREAAAVRDEDVEVVVFRLDDGSFIPLEADGYVDVLNEGRADAVPVQELSAGHRLLLIRGAVRSNLYELLLHAAENSPAASREVANVQTWRRELVEGYELYGHTYTDIVAQLGFKGSFIRTASAVRLWVKGAVIGPRDPRDMLRMGEILDVEDLRRRWREIAASVRWLRRLHRSLAYQLDAAIMGRSVSDNDSAIFRSAGLRFADLRKAVEVTAVTERLPGTGTMSRLRVGVPFFVR